MNREEITEAIHDLARSPHMATYALEHAMGALSLNQLVEVFDAVADHHSLLHDIDSVLNRGIDVDLGRLAGGSTGAGDGSDPRRILCAHAHFDGRGAHWLAPGEVCAFAQF